MNQKDNEQAALAQRVQTNRARLRTSEIKNSLDRVSEKQKKQQEELDELEKFLDEELLSMGIDVDNIQLDKIKLENIGLDNIGLENVELDGSEHVEFMTEEEKAAIYEKNRSKFKELETIKFDSYESYLEATKEYLKNANIDLEIDPITQLFSGEELKELLEQYAEKYEKLKWCKLDYTMVGIASVIAILLDIFLVAIPEDMNFLGKEYKGSPITKKLKEVTVNLYEGNTDSKIGNWIHSAITSLEDYAKVPYDVSRNGILDETVDGLRPTLHRFMSLGHDPILGFIFGVIDIMRGTMTVIDKNGVLQILQNGEGSINIFSAFIKVFAHLLSDICTKAGIAPPFMSLLELCTGKSPFILRKDGTKVGFNDVARFMYSHGYDMRHMLTMGIVPLTVEFIIRTYYNFYYFDSLFDYEKDIRHKCKKNSMLAVSHSVVMGGDILKMWMYGWNPLAFNYSEFLMLVKTSISVAKSNKAYNKMIEDKLTEEWESIIGVNKQSH